MRRLIASAAWVGALVLLGGCATTGAVNAQNGRPALERDPLEGWNRGVYAFNDALDRNVVKPVATAYRDVVPALVRTGVGNFFGNLGDVWSAANQLLQGKAENGLNMGMRVMTNTLFGLGGVLDPASEMGLDRKSEDFGQTLGRWGVGPGPYLVLPLLGPSTLRDTFALPLDLAGTPPRWSDDGTRLATGALRVVDTRAGLLSASRLLDDIALDPYSFLRDAYLSRRRNQVYDGDPPEEAAEPAPPK